MWVVDNLTDVKSDMSVFHRVDDIFRMAAHAFFSYAVRLPAYNGIIRRRIQAKADQEEAARRATSPVRSSQAATSTAPNQVPESVLFANLERDGWGERVTS